MVLRHSYVFRELVGGPACDGESGAEGGKIPAVNRSKSGSRRGLQREIGRGAPPSGKMSDRADAPHAIFYLSGYHLA
jgi:hypothetical protein